jgi:phosphodiesterase/alkaline phosphatase D-like protein
MSVAFYLVLLNLVINSVLVFAEEVSEKPLADSQGKNLIAVLTNKTILNEDISLFFGSCFKNRIFKHYHIFKDLAKHQPDVFMWTGDVVYLDMKKSFKQRSVDLYNELKFSEGT